MKDSREQAFQQTLDKIDNNFSGLISDIDTLPRTLKIIKLNLSSNEVGNLDFTKQGFIHLKIIENKATLVIWNNDFYLSDSLIMRGQEKVYSVFREGK